MSDERRKVMVIGIDGGTLDLIKPWADAEKLPNFASLLAEGSWGKLTSTIHPLTAPAWTSFMTGMDPGKHGIFDFISLRPKSYEISYNNASTRRAKSLWKLLSEANRRVIVVNVPFTYPPEEVRGILISGLDTPSLQSPFTYPAGVYHQLMQAVGDYVVMVEQSRSESRGSYLNRLLDMVENRAAATLYLMEHHPWDFFMVVFSATDVVQHSFWKYMDHTHPDYDPKEAAIYGDAILKVYQKVDQVLGQVLERLPQEAVLMVMSDHGFGPFKKAVYLNRWLASEGWLTHHHVGKQPKGHDLKKLLMAMKSAAPQRFKEMIRERLPWLKNKVNSYLLSASIDWAHTKAFSCGVHGSIMVNLQGRQPQGTVAPNKEYEDLRTDIIDRLRSLCDPDSGEPVVERAFRREELYHGPYVDLAPDLIITWKDYAYTAQQDFMGGTGPIFERRSHFEFSQREHNGSHRLEGVVALWGNGVRRGHEIYRAAIIDLAPTILYLLGELIPKDMDGRVLKEAIEPGFFKTIPPKFVDKEMHLDQRFTPGVYSEEEALQVEERLKNLGYL